MRDDEEFNVMLVLVIEKHEVLYNYRLENYTNRNVREVAWQKVAIDVNCTVEECKKRWRILRISFLRHLRERKKFSDSSAKKKKTYYLEDAMKYLTPYTKSRRSVGIADFDQDEMCKDYSKLDNSQIINNNEESVNSSDIPQNSVKDENSLIEIHEPCTSDLYESDTVSSQTTQMFSSKKRKIQSTGNWENATELTAMNNKCNVNTQTKQSSDGEDSDLLFLKSLLPDLKKLSDVQKRRFKQRIFVLYDEILNEVSARSTEQNSLQTSY